MRYELKEITYAKPKSLIYNLFKYSLFFSSSFNIIMTPNVFLSYCPRFVVGPSLKFILLNSCSHNKMIFLRLVTREKKELASKKRKKMRFENQPITGVWSAILKHMTILSQSGAVRRLWITTHRERVSRQSVGQRRRR